MADYWRVVSQQQRENLTPQGTFEPTWYVTYELLPEGVQGTVVIPQRLYTEDYVRDAIEQAAAVNRAVHNL